MNTFVSVNTFNANFKFQYKTAQATFCKQVISFTSTTTSNPDEPAIGASDVQTRNGRKKQKKKAGSNHINVNKEESDGHGGEG
jgi:hypothetical protein